MTTVQYLHRHAIPTAYALLPSTMQRKEATALLIAIAMQESRCEHRYQVLKDGDRGPARGFWQFERSGVSGIVLHRASAPHLRLVCQTLRVTMMPTSIYEALEWNDPLAACCARLLLWTLPDVLPDQSQPDEAWHVYLKAWRPGKPHRSTWDACYAAGWTLAGA